MHRILNATATREEYHAAKKQKKEEEIVKANKKAGNANVSSLALLSSAPADSMTT